MISKILNSVPNNYQMSLTTTEEKKSEIKGILSSFSSNFKELEEKEKEEIKQLQLDLLQKKIETKEQTVKAMVTKMIYTYFNLCAKAT